MSIITRSLLVLCVFVGNVWLPTSVWAADENPSTTSLTQQPQTLYAFSSPKLRSRYDVLIAELRCPKCQNQNIADSDAVIAKDLRYQVRRMLEEQQSDADIKHFLADVYGDFILYNPPFKWQTLFLWLGPSLFLLLGAWLMYRSARHKQDGSLDIKPLNAKEQAQLKQLLEQDT